jgi:site-specific recombinase XerD
LCRPFGPEKAGHVWRSLGQEGGGKRVHRLMPVDPTTISKRLQFVRTFFHDAPRRKLIPSNPFAAVTSKAFVRLDQRRFVTQTETDKLLEACPNHDCGYL